MTSGPVRWRSLWGMYEEVDRLFFFYRPTPTSFSFIFGLFKQNHYNFLQQINVKKCPSSIRRWDSNPQPFEHDSSPITTRPGLPPLWIDCDPLLLIRVKLCRKRSICTSDNLAWSNWQVGLHTTYLVECLYVLKDTNFKWSFTRLRFGH